LATKNLNHAAASESVREEAVPASDWATLRWMRCFVSKGAPQDDVKTAFSVGLEVAVNREKR
jgi:hypothetical protein